MWRRSDQSRPPWRQLEWAPGLTLGSSWSTRQRLLACSSPRVLSWSSQGEPSYWSKCPPWALRWRTPRPHQPPSSIVAWAAPTDWVSPRKSWSGVEHRMVEKANGKNGTWLRYAASLPFPAINLCARANIADEAYRDRASSAAVRLSLLIRLNLWRNLRGSRVTKLVARTSCDFASTLVHARTTRNVHF